MRKKTLNLFERILDCTKVPKHNNFLENPMDYGATARKKKHYNNLLVSSHAAFWIVLAAENHNIDEAWEEAEEAVLYVERVLSDYEKSKK